MNINISELPGYPIGAYRPLEKAEIAGDQDFRKIQVDLDIQEISTTGDDAQTLRRNYHTDKGLTDTRSYIVRLLME